MPKAFCIVLSGLDHANRLLSLVILQSKGNFVHITRKMKSIGLLLFLGCCSIEGKFVHCRLHVTLSSGFRKYFGSAITDINM